MRWQPRRASVISAYYRYQQNTAANLDGHGTNQIDLSAQWPLSNRWYGVGRYNYSFEDSSLSKSSPASNIRRIAGSRVSRTKVSDHDRIDHDELLFPAGTHRADQCRNQALSQLQRNIPGYQRINPLPRQPGMFEYYE